MRTLTAAALAAVLLAAPSPVRAEPPEAAARRIAESFRAQLARRPPPTPLRTVAVAPPAPGDPAAASLRALGAALGPALVANGLPLRPWSDLDAAARERWLQRLAAGKGEVPPPDLPPPPGADALVVLAAPGAAGKAVRAQARLVAVPSGAVLATEAADVDAPAAQAVAAKPAVGAPATVEVAVRRLGDALAAEYGRRPGARYERVAVLDLSENGAGARKHELGKVVGAELATALRRDHGLLLVERARVGAVLAELKLAEMGVVEKRARDVGQLADAQTLVLGSVSDAGDRYLVDVRLVSTERGEAIAAASEGIQAAGLVALSSEAVVLRSRGDAAFRSLVLPGWGQVYNRQPAKAAMFGGGVALLLGGALAFHVSGKNAENDYKSLTTATALGSDPSSAAADLRQTAEDRYAVRNYLLYAAAGVWALNVLDAYLSGTDGKTAVVAAPQPGGGAVLIARRF